MKQIIQLDWALVFFRKRMEIIAVHGVDENGHCTCGQIDCKKSGKHAMFKGWPRFKSEDEMRAFWLENPRANYGIITDGFPVIDIDERNGGQKSFELYLAPVLAGIPTLEVQTGSGGASRHLYLCDPEKQIKCAKIFSGIDLKGIGGYVVGPGSRHHSGGWYRPSNWNGVGDLPIANVPAALKGILLRPRKNNVGANDETSGSKGRLSKETLDFITNGASDGDWHDRLIPALFDLKAQNYSQQEATVQVRKASLSAHGDLDDEDLNQIRDVYEKRKSFTAFRESFEGRDEAKISEKVRTNLSNIVQMNTVLRKPVKFIWEPYIARGFVTLLTGDPGTGKSTFMLHIAAIISRGGHFWDNKITELGKVLIFTVEDPLGEVLQPRLSKANANLENVFALALPIEFDDTGKATIREAIVQHKPAFIVIDPIVAYIGAKIDTNRANEVRSKMTFLSELAAEFGLAILVIRHCSKSNGNENSPLIYRGHGSIDFVASVRSELMLISDPKNNDGRLFGHTKSNLTRLGNTLYFTMTDNGPILSRIDKEDLNRLLNSISSHDMDGTAIGDAAKAIRQILLKGPAFQKNLLEELKGAGFTQATIRRGLDSVAPGCAMRISFTGLPRGAGAWLICTEEQRQTLSELKFEHLEQLERWLSDYSVQDAQILTPKT